MSRALWVGLLWLLPALAAARPVADEEAELAALLAVIAEETELATRSRMNADFVPGMVSVLEAEHLAALGVRTVWEAMSWIPGVEAVRDPRGTPSVTVRGVPYPFNNGNIRILIDGVPISRDSAGVSSAVLLFPIVQVERIEFVRGPGSVIHGEYAYQGLLNIIVRRNDQTVAFEIDERNGRGLHALTRGARADWSWAVNLSAIARDEAVILGPSRAEEQRQLALFSLKGHGLSLSLHGLRREQSGQGSRPPPLDADERSEAAELRWRGAVADALELGLRGQWQGNRLDIGAISFDGDQWSVAGEVVWRGLEGQQWLFGIEHSEGQIDDAVFRPVAPPGQPPAPHVQIAGRGRQVSGFLLENQIALGPRLQATLGARFDDNSEAGSRWTPRAALAWRIAESHLLKAQLAQGYRSPTFFELYLNSPPPDLDFEINRTGELSYVFRKPGATARLTLFQADYLDMVFPDLAARQFGNFGRARSRGFEVEWSQQLASDWRIDTTWAVIDAEDNRRPDLSRTQRIATTPPWLGQIALLWQAAADSTVGLRWQRSGQRDAAPPGDGDYQRLDLTWTRRNLLLAGLELQLGVHNLTPREIVYIEAEPQAPRPFVVDERLLWLGLRWTY